MIRKYSLAKDGAKLLAPDFKVRELRCRDGSDTVMVYKSSQHLLGRAADIRVQGVSVEDVAAYAERLMPDWGGIGHYPVKAGRATGWVHVDTRQNKSRWTL